MVDSIGGNLDITRSTLLQDVIQDFIECLGPGRIGHGRDCAEKCLRYGQGLRHGRESSECRGGVESVVQQSLVGLIVN